MQKTMLLRRLVNGFASSLFLLTANLLFFSNAHAVPHPASQPHTGTGEWVYDNTVDNVDCYHMLTECEGTTVVLLKFNNKNSGKVKISWNELFTTQLRAQQESYAGKKQMVLAPGESFPASCTDSKEAKLRILPTQAIPTYKAEIKGFAYKDITVTKVV